MKRFFVVTILVSLLSATGAHSETDTSDNPRQLPDSIVVSANRYATPVAEVASSITIISADMIERSQAVMVEQILRDVPGLDVVQSGGLGKLTSIFLRGANSHHTLVIIDGVKMNNPASSNGAFDFSHLTTENIQRIEILRGAQSVLYGSDAIGGVIQIFTKRGNGKPKLEISSRTGSYNTFMESISLSGSHQQLDYALSIAQKNSNGYSATTGNSDNLEKDGYQNTSLSGQIGFKANSSYELTWSGSYNDTKSDIDNSFGVLDDPNNTSDAKTVNTSLSVDKVNKTKYWNPSLSFSFMSTDFSSSNQEDDYHPGEISNYNSTGKRIKASFQNRFNHSGNFSSLVGLETDRESFESVSSSISPFWTSNDTVDSKETDVTSLYILNSVNAVENWHATIGIRQDMHDEIDDVTTWRITTAYFIQDFGLKLRATYGTGFKKPSLFQLQHPTWGNPNLLAEESNGWEIGLDQSFEDIGMTVGADYFENTFDNLIDYNDSTRQNENISKASSKGAEFYMSYTYRTLRLAADYTYSEAINDLTDELLIRRPRLKLNINSSLQLIDHLNAGLKFSYVGKRDDLDFTSFPTQTVTLDSYSLVNLLLKYDISPTVELFGEIVNLADKTYTEVLTYNTSRRAVYAGAKVTF